MNSSSPSLPWEMILIEHMADGFFASSEFLLPAEFLSAQLCEEQNICLGLKAFHSLCFPAFQTDLILSSSAQLVFCFCKTGDTTLVEAESRECLETTRKEICGTVSEFER